MMAKVYCKLTKGNSTYSYVLTKNKLTEPSIAFTKGNETYYGTLLKTKPSTPTIQVGDRYLNEPLGKKSVTLFYECKSEEYRSHPNVGTYFRRIQVFNSDGEDITSKCKFDETHFWFSVYDHKYHNHWPSDDRKTAISQVKPGFDGNYNTQMQQRAGAGKNHTANTWIRVFYTVPEDEYVGIVKYQFGSWCRIVNGYIRFGYFIGTPDYSGLSNLKLFEPAFGTVAVNTTKQYDLTKIDV